MLSSNFDEEYRKVYFKEEKQRKKLQNERIKMIRQNFENSIK